MCLGNARPNPEQTAHAAASKDKSAAFQQPCRPSTPERRYVPSVSHNRNCFLQRYTRCKPFRLARALMASDPLDRECCTQVQGFTTRTRVPNEKRLGQLLLSLCSADGLGPWPGALKPRAASASRLRGLRGVPQSLHSKADERKAHKVARCESMPVKCRCAAEAWLCHTVGIS